MDNKRKYILYLSVAILALVNVFILYKYKSLDEKYVDNQHANNLRKYRSNSYSISNKLMSLPNIIKNVINNSKCENIVNTEPIEFIVFSTNNDCTNCITNTISYLRKGVLGLNNKLLFIYEEVNDESYKYSDFFDHNNYNFLNIPMNIVDKFSAYDIDQFPIFIMYNHDTNSVVEAYQPEPNNYEALEAFIKRVKYHK